MSLRPAQRQACLAAGLATLALAWLAPLPAFAHRPGAYLFSAHMAVHLAVVAVAAPLLALGLAGTRADPAARLPRLFSPALASALEFVIVWAWHAPGLHLAARARPSVALLEQGSFLAAGLLVWLAAFGGTGPTAARQAAGLAGLLLTSMHMTLLGVLLATAPRALYLHGGAAPGAALQDQQFGGVLMLAVGGSVYLGGALALLHGLLMARQAEAGHG